MTLGNGTNAELRLIVCCRGCRHQVEPDPFGLVEPVALCSHHVRRARLFSDVSEIKLVFSIPSHRPTPNIAPSLEHGANRPLSGRRYAGERSLDLMRWGLVPFWSRH